MGLTANAIKFMAKDPYHYGTRNGNKYYECPSEGDEGPLWLITSEGKLKRSEWWEYPTQEEADQAL